MPQSRVILWGTQQTSADLPVGVCFCMYAFMTPRSSMSVWNVPWSERRVFRGYSGYSWDWGWGGVECWKSRLKKVKSYNACAYYICIYVCTIFGFNGAQVYVSSTKCVVSLNLSFSFGLFAKFSRAHL